MKTPVFWIGAKGADRLGTMARPRGGDWLEAEIESLKKENVAVLVSLLTQAETQELRLTDEGRLCKAKGIDFLSYPLPDRGVPTSFSATKDLANALLRELEKGRDTVIHCRQGIGRASLLAACVLGLADFQRSPEAILEAIALARRCPVPDTPEQTNWVKSFLSRSRSSAF